MAFQTGSLSTLSNIIDTLDTFAVANGYTKNQKYTNGNWYILSLTKNSLVYNIAVDTVNDVLELQIPTSHTASTAWGSDPGANISEPQANNLTGLSGYDFFANGTNIRAVIKLSDGRYKNFAFGETLRPGYSGYAFCGATYWAETGTTQPYTPNVTNHCHLMSGYGAASHYSAIRVAGTLYYQKSAGTDFKTYGWRSFKNDLLEFAPGDSNLRASGVAKLLFIKNGLTGASLRFDPIGYVEGMIDINVTALPPETVVDTDWVAYPYIKRDIGQATSGEVSSQDWGLAFKK